MAADKTMASAGTDDRQIEIPDEMDYRKHVDLASLAPTGTGGLGGTDSGLGSIGGLQAQPSPLSPAPTAAHPSTSAPSFQVTLKLDPEVHSYFTALAEEDERPLSKYLARVLRGVWMDKTTAPPDHDRDHLTR
jgi:hypothetical protein